MGCPLTIEARASGRKLSENDQRLTEKITFFETIVKTGLNLIVVLRSKTIHLCDIEKPKLNIEVSMNLCQNV